MVIENSKNHFFFSKERKNKSKSPSGVILHIFLKKILLPAPWIGLGVLLLCLTTATFWDRCGWQVKYGKSIAAIDMCRIDDPDAALEEAKKKFQAILKMRK